MPITRRNFFTRTGLVAAGAMAAPALVQGQTSRRAWRAGQKPKHIIHMVADGMSAGTLACADMLSHIHRKRGTVWMDLISNPDAKNGLMNMRSLNSLVTDSSAASSSWGCGSRIVNGAVNTLPDGRALTPLYTLFGQKGWRRGLVTTTEITHATPAGFAANDNSRGAGETIAQQYFERRVDLLLGGGLNHFRADKRGDKRDLVGDFKKAGYAVCLTADELRAAPRDARWLGLFSGGHVPFTVDHRHSEDARKKVPTLAEMTRAALENLSRHRNFILQVEGGRVDHGAHNCDAAGAFFDQIAFDDAIEVCLEFQKKEPGTLIVITTDHGNANPGLNGMGDGYGKSPELLGNLTRFKSSFSGITGKLKDTSTPAEIQEVLGELTGYKLSEKKAVQFAEYLQKKWKPLYSSMDSTTAQLGQLLGDHIGIGFIGGAHTGDYVQITAQGPGAEKFHGFVQNTEVFYHYLDFAGIKFRNPTMPLQAIHTPAQSRERVEEYAMV